MKKLQPYIRSFRLRTLPLSVSGILLGTLFAYSEGKYDNRIFLLAITTTLCLQILSNLANELGDALKGTDNNNRLGPTRSIQAGLLTQNDFRHLIAGFVILSLLSGTSLVVLSFRNLFCYKSHRRCCHPGCPQIYLRKKSLRLPGTRRSFRLPFLRFTQHLRRLFSNDPHSLHHTSPASLFFGTAMRRCPECKQHPGYRKR